MKESNKNYNFGRENLQPLDSCNQDQDISKRISQHFTFIYCNPCISCKSIILLIIIHCFAAYQHCHSAKTNTINRRITDPERLFRQGVIIRQVRLSCSVQITRTKIFNDSMCCFKKDRTLIGHIVMELFSLIDFFLKEAAKGLQLFSPKEF